MKIPIVIGLALQDALGAVFAVCVILWAVNRAYKWIINPDIEARRRKAADLIEEMHRQHWKELARKAAKKK